LKIVAASSIAEPLQHSPVHAFINRNKWLLGLVEVRSTSGEQCLVTNRNGAN